MDKPFRIVISVDSKWRDLPGYVLLKAFLEDVHGHQVYLIRKGRERQDIPIIRPHIVFLSHLLTLTRVRLAYWLKAHGILVALLHDEGNPLRDDLRLLMAGKYTDMRPVDLHFVWNEGMKRLMAEHRLLPDERVVVAGVPRFDFYAAAFRPLLMNKASFSGRFGLDPALPIVTWTTNFFAAKFAHKWQDHLESHAKEVGHTALKELGSPSELAHQEFESRKVATQAVRRLLQEIPGINLVIRPHPKEDVAYYRQVLREFKAIAPRVALAEKLYIWDVLNSTDVLLQRYCTTGIEGWFFDLPTLELHLNPRDTLRSPEAEAGHICVETYEQLRQQVEHFLQGAPVARHIMASRGRYTEERYHEVDGLRTKMCAAVIDQFLQSHAQPVEFRPLERAEALARGKVVGALDTLLSLRGWITGQGMIIRHGELDTYITPGDVRHWLRRIRSAGVLRGVIHGDSVVAEGPAVPSRGVKVP